MLKLKAGTGVDKNKLLIDASALDIDHLHEAARIDIQKWIDNVQPYLSFVKKSQVAKMYHFTSGEPWAVQNIQIQKKTLQRR